jgi:hypothetical protein
VLLDSSNFSSSRIDENPNLASSTAKSSGAHSGIE